MSKTSVNFYETKDLAFSGSLLCMNQKMLNVKKIDGVCWFIFENYDKCKELESKYNFEQLLVNAKTYYEHCRQLKRLVFSQ